jgi:ribonuclease T2
MPSIQSVGGFVPRHRLFKVLTVCFCLALTLSATAGKHHSQSAASSADNTPGKFDYYLLVLSWAPEFCATHQSNMSSSECDPTRHYGFVVHGLWPQNDDGSYPTGCGNARPVSNEIVREMLPIMPARGLIQHEWSTHGTCTGLSAQEYFGELQQLYQSVKIPDDYQHPSAAFSAKPGNIEQKFAQANRAPQSAFRVSCRAGEFVAIEACFDKNLKYRDCGSSLKECQTPQVTVLPTP